MNLKFLFVIPVLLFATAAGIFIYGLGVSHGIQIGGNAVIQSLSSTGPI